jgi:hypothetical protein
VKRFVQITITIVFLLSVIGIPALAKKAGEIKDGVYRDDSYGFSITIPETWSANIKKSKSVIRLTMDEKSPVPPFHFQGDLRDYMQIPTMVLIVDTTSFDVGTFVDSLLASGYDSKQKKYFMKYLKIVSRPHEIIKRREVTIEGETAVILEARQAYEMEVSQRGSDRASVVNDYKYGSIFFTVRDGHVYILHMICEYQTSATILEVYNLVLGSLKFGPGPEAEAETKEEG